MNVLITGANGFVGRHLTAYLTQQHPEFTLLGTDFRSQADGQSPLKWYTLDLRDSAAVEQMLVDAQPDLIFHLAAQAFVPASLDDPWDTLENNIRGQVNILDSLRQNRIQARVLVVSSAHVYGKIEQEDNPLREDQPFQPDTPYAVSKVTQDMLALQYRLAHDIYTIRARPFNHIGPGQNNRFALPNFAEQIAAIEAGDKPPVLQVGNLDAERDFTDVRDVVRAYTLLLLHGKAGEAYNICRGEGVTVRELLEIMCKASHVSMEIQFDPARNRPLDIPRIVGDNSKVCQQTGWYPQIDLSQSITDILDYARTTKGNS